MIALLVELLNSVARKYVMWYCAPTFVVDVQQSRGFKFAGSMLRLNLQCSRGAKSPASSQVFFRRPKKSVACGRVVVNGRKRPPLLVKIQRGSQTYRTLLFRSKGVRGSSLSSLSFPLRFALSALALSEMLSADVAVITFSPSGFWSRVPNSNSMGLSWPGCLARKDRSVSMPSSSVGNIGAGPAGRC